MSKKRQALIYQEMLIMSWLLTLPWRQRNVREMKLGPIEDGGNLGKSRVPPLATLAKPGWVEEALRANPRAEFWQFYFRSEETKTHHTVHAFLPKQLVPLVEEFLEHYRPYLIRDHDPKTLFITSRGTAFTEDTLRNLVGQITLRYTGRRLNPHLLRDVFAVKWLEGHPEDYLTLSKILWHQDVNTTIRIYGRNFDESHGARRVEQWLEGRGIL